MTTAIASAQQMTLALSNDELSTFVQCEHIIERGLDTWHEVGDALRRIRDEKLYRADQKTFEDYCGERWGLQRRRAYALMEAAEVRGQVCEISHVAPVRESHAAALAAVPSEQRAEVWQRALESANGNRLTEKTVRAAARSFLPPAPELPRPAPRPAPVTAALTQYTLPAEEADWLAEEGLSLVEAVRLVRRLSGIAAEKGRDVEWLLRLCARPGLK